jgi:hypothetical protein
MTMPLKIVHTLLEEWEVMLEDRIDDLVQQYAQTMKWERRDIENMARYDPSRNKKYLPWLLKQAAENPTLTDQNYDGIHDLLMEFERLLTLPSFTGSRDIYSYSLPDFERTITANMELRSQSELDRKAKAAKKKTVSSYEHKEGVKSVGTLGNLELLQITSAESLAWWAWRGYMQENPNWNRPTIQPPPPGQEVSIHDGKWCVRNTTHGNNYLRKEPFYLVLKGGWPYVGILLAQGQVKNLDNDQINMGVAEEVYPLVEPFISALKAEGGSLKYESTIFEHMRFLQGGVKPGESFRDDVNLSNSSLTSLPANLTFHDTVTLENTKITEIPPNTVAKRGFSAKGSAITKIGEGFECGGELDLSNTPLTALPEGIKAESINVANTKLTELPENLSVSTLHIEGTFITKLPSTLVVARSMTWSEPMTLEECKMQFFRNTLPKLKVEAAAHPRMTGLSPAAMAKAWSKAEKELLKYYMTDKSIDGHVKSMFVYKKPSRTTEEK